MSVVDPNENGQYQCPDCDRAFDTAQGLGAHRARTHGYRRDDGIGLLVDQGQVEPVTVLIDRKPPEPFEPADTPRDFNALADALDQASKRQYEEATAEYLPFLAREVQRRGEADLVTAFVTLFLDVS